MNELTKAILTHCKNNKMPASTCEQSEWAAGYTEALATVENLLRALPYALTDINGPADLAEFGEPDDYFELEPADVGPQHWPPPYKSDERIGATGDNNRPFNYRAAGLDELDDLELVCEIHDFYAGANCLEECPECKDAELQAQRETDEYWELQAEIEAGQNPQTAEPMDYEPSEFPYGEFQTGKQWNDPDFYNPDYY